MKLCKDCIHCLVRIEYMWYACNRPSFKIDLVTGKTDFPSGSPLSCDGERLSGECGPQGKFYKEKIK